MGDTVELLTLGLIWEVEENTAGTAAKLLSKTLHPSKMQAFNGIDRHKKHNRKFFDLLEDKLPDWEELKTELELKLLG